MNPFTNIRPPDYNNPPPPPSNYPPNYNYNYNYPPAPPGPPGYPGHPGPPGPVGYPGHAPPPPNYYNQNYNHPPPPQNHMHGPPPNHFPPNAGLYKPPQPPTTLTISKSPNDSSLLHLTPASSAGHGDPIPQYTVQISKNNKPHIKLYRGPYLLPNPLGTASMHTWSSTTDCFLASSDPSNFRVKESALGGYFTIDHPRPLGPGSGTEKGTCKWKESLMSSTMDLQDGKGGNKVAKIRISTGLSGQGKMVETHVPLSEEAMDMVVLSGVVAMVVSKDMLEDGLDILGDVLDN